MEVNKLCKKYKVIRLDFHDIDAVYDLCRCTSIKDWKNNEQK